MTTDVTTHVSHHDVDGHHDGDAIDVFGFWIYILTDCILFATLFATYAVLHNNTFGQPGIKQLVSLPYVLTETIALLISSFTYGLAMLALYRGKRGQVISWLVVTFLFGAVFIGLELNEFIHLYLDGHSWHSSAALSAFFTLVGTHGLHVTIGLIWMATLIFQLCKYKVTPFMGKRLTYLGLFWHFLDIVWIFVFTIVYLMGAL